MKKSLDHAHFHCTKCLIKLVQNTKNFNKCNYDNIGASLKYHHAAFHGEGVPKPFQCEKCSAGFPTKTKLKRHVECVHEGIKPWKCVACDANFSEKSKLTMHYTKFHEGKTPEDDGFFDAKPRKPPGLNQPLLQQDGANKPYDSKMGR